MKEIDWQKRIWEIWDSRKLILKVCGIGAIIGIIIGFGTPKEYTASTLIAPESIRRSTSSGMSALVGMAGIDINSSAATERDAIYPSLYPIIVNSTPFLIQLFEIKVCEQKDSTPITLVQYLKERQKKPWWSEVTSAPSRLISWTVSLFRKKPKMEKRKSGSGTNLFQLTREEAGIAGAIASRIKVGVDKEKRTITLFVTMQDPLVAATVVDTVSAHLKEYITEYRTSKARRSLEYYKNLRKEAQVEYYVTQEKYTRYADANRNLARLTSHAELSRLRSEMNLVFSIYNQRKLQVQAARARVEKVTPVYAVIQPAIVPLAPSKPRKMMILMTYVFLSAAGSIAWVLLGKDLLENIKRRRQTAIESK